MENKNNAKQNNQRVETFEKNNSRQHGGKIFFNSFNSGRPPHAVITRVQIGKVRNGDDTCRAVKERADKNEKERGVFFRREFYILHR